VNVVVARIFVRAFISAKRCYVSEMIKIVMMLYSNDGRGGNPGYTGNGIVAFLLLGHE
jgi:hypothetical protein